MARNLYGNVRSEGGGPGFEITEMAIEGGEGLARADDPKVDSVAARFAKVVLGSFHQLAAQADALPRRVDAEQAQVATIAAKFEIDTTGQNGGNFSNEEFPFGHVRANAFGLDSVTFDEGQFDSEGGVDQTGEVLRIRERGHAKNQGIVLRAGFGGILHVSIGILT